MSGPLQGFGQLWQKTFRVELDGSLTPQEVVAAWKERFPTFWPKGARFYAPLAGIAPGEVALLDIAPVPGSPVKLSTGVMVIYADDESFTFMTPEGHTLSAWITFSAYRDGEATVVQAQALERTSDPFDELAYMLGGNRMNDRFWRETLSNVATRDGQRGPGSTPRSSASTSDASGGTPATCATAPRCGPPATPSPHRSAGSPARGDDGRAEGVRRRPTPSWRPRRFCRRGRT